MIVDDQNGRGEIEVRWHVRVPRAAREILCLPKQG
jgi:hypothetical protein